MHCTETAKKILNLSHVKKYGLTNLLEGSQIAVQCLEKEKMKQIEYVNATLSD